MDLGMTKNSNRALEFCNTEEVYHYKHIEQSDHELPS